MEIAKAAITAAPVVAEVVRDVLKPKRSNNQRARGGKGKRAPSRPYARQARGPKPARKTARPINQTRNRGLGGNAPIPVRAATSIGRSYLRPSVTKYKGRDAMLFSGMDFYGTLTTGSNNSVYYPLFTLPVNPLAIPGTRLGIEAQLWTKFKFRSIEVIFVPVGGTTATGAMLMSHVDDPEIALPSPGSVAYVDALAQSAGAKVVQIWSEASHKWSPSATDPREFYIHPDLDGENRLTDQAQLYLVGLSNLANNTTQGMIFVRYSVMLYEKVVTNSALNSMYSIAISPTTRNVSTVQMYDGGATGVISQQVAASTPGFANGTVYVVYYNFSLGGIRAMQIYFWKCIDSAAGYTLYKTQQDAAAQATTGAVQGSIFGTGSLPSNATMYYTPAGTFPSLQKDVPDYTELLNMFSDLKLTVQDLVQTSNNNANKLSPMGLVRPLKF
jgi:hypothetical protein